MYGGKRIPQHQREDIGMKNSSIRIIGNNASALIKYNWKTKEMQFVVSGKGDDAIGFDVDVSKQLLDVIEFRPLAEMTEEELAGLCVRIKEALKPQEQSTGKPFWIELF